MSKHQFQKKYCSSQTDDKGRGLIFALTVKDNNFPMLVHSCAKPTYVGQPKSNQTHREKEEERCRQGPKGNILRA